MRLIDADRYIEELQDTVRRCLNPEVSLGLMWAIDIIEEQQIIKNLGFDSNSSNDGVYNIGVGNKGSKNVGLGI